MAFSKSLEWKWVNLGWVACFCFLLWGCQKTENSVSANTLPSFATQSESVFTLTLGSVVMRVDAARAARVTSLTIDGQEILVRPQDIKTGMWGSSFWTSPQKEWQWPPLVTLDSAPYAISVESDALIFTSKIEEKTRYQFIKKYTVDRAQNAFSIHYTIINHSSEEKHFGAWEVTRLKPQGHVFFPKGNGEIFSGMFYPLDTVITEGITWFNYEPSKIKENHHKLMTDGKEGWIAYTDKRFLLVKSFADVPAEKMVPGEAEVAIFASHEKDYLEIAAQGEYTAVPPEGKLEWDVRWYLESLPESQENTQMNPALIQWVREKIQGSVPKVQKAKK